MGESYRIQLSPELINRFARDGDKLKKKTKMSKPKISEDKPQNSAKSASAAPITGSSGGGWPLQPPMFLPAPPAPPQTPAVTAELEAVRSVLLESEKVIERLEKQEANMVQELNQRAKELRDKEFKLPYQRPMPCLAEREACLQCYKEQHSKDPLKCAQVVSAFADCARQARQQQESSTH